MTAANMPYVATLPFGMALHTCATWRLELSPSSNVIGTPLPSSLLSQHGQRGPSDQSNVLRRAHMERKSKAALPHRVESLFKRCWRPCEL